MELAVVRDQRKPHLCRRRPDVVCRGGVGSGNTSSSYGFSLNTPSNCAAGGPQSNWNIGKLGGTLTTVTVKHSASLGCGPAFNVAQSGIALGCGNCYLTNFTVANNFLDGFTPSFNITNLSNSTSGWAFFYLGITYTTLGAWDVGAYEFAAPGSDALPPAKPKGVKLP